MFPAWRVQGSGFSQLFVVYQLRNFLGLETQTFPRTSLFDGSVEDDHFICEPKVLGFIPKVRQAVKAPKIPDDGLLEFVIQTTVVPSFLKRPSGPRRFSDTWASVLPSKALNESSRMATSYRW